MLCSASIAAIGQLGCLSGHLLVPPLLFFGHGMASQVKCTLAGRMSAPVLVWQKGLVVIPPPIHVFRHTVWLPSSRPGAVVVCGLVFVGLCALAAPTCFPWTAVAVPVTLNGLPTWHKPLDTPLVTASTECALA